MPYDCFLRSSVLFGEACKIASLFIFLGSNSEVLFDCDETMRYTVTNFDLLNC
jgi:hypothetical protein